ncbi:hypothetical protein BDZ94DRAFT_1264434 [Collybia nuda]|uniref:Uncharacterized protein n=1 Tax=Collybia nuda TaxID=64659 RepID=A0A9P6CCX3_9AGAR|nr:hypothetical protein BDZ94DRAFT_1264434 [Collybia nuda]
MAPSEYSLRLQRGIVGGFAPPTPDAIHTLTKVPENPNILIASAVRPEGTPELQSATAKSLQAAQTVTEALVDELHAILKVLPTEVPPGSEDIYGLNTSIAWGSDDLEWCNGGPQGCGGGTSAVQPTEEEKAKFRRAVEIVDELVGKAA